MQFDVFNGDADGICALLQLRLADARDSILVTGVKRDIALLQRVPATAGDRVTVLDLSLDKNRPALLDLLQQQVEIFYVDHHQASDLPHHPRFNALIDTNADVCTSLLVDRYLEHRFTAWAVTAAFGDNLDARARHAAAPLALRPSQLEQLRQLGVCINYNAYGGCVEDLHLTPEQLFRQLSGYASPFEFIAERHDLYQNLLEAYRADMALTDAIHPEFANDNVAVYVLPNEKWARRVSGVWSNALAHGHPDRAHAVLSLTDSGDFQVSVRAPLSKPMGADELCARFPTGGGRKAAAGINQLSPMLLTSFIEALADQYQHREL